VIITPLAILLATARHGSAATSISSLEGAGAIATALMLWSQWQVARGRWRHIDASAPAERIAFDRVAFAVVGTGALVAALARSSPTGRDHRGRSDRRRGGAGLPAGVTMLL